MSQTLRRGFLILLPVLLSLPMLSRAQAPAAGVSGNRTASVLKVDGGVPYFKGWLEQDVVWIITDQERAAFKLLKNDEERDNFIEAFWERRDPTPETYENEYKEEHYRRIVYANDHSVSRMPGWKSDRGRFYIMFGPPDEIESFATKAEDKDSSADASSYPLEVWHFRYVEGIGEDVVLEFVDKCKCGDLRMPVTLVREKDAQSNAPKDLSDAWRSRPEMTDRRFNRRIDTPRVRFKELEEKAIVDLPWKQLPFEVKTDTVKATDVTSVVPITITFQKHDLVFPKIDNRRHSVTLNIFGRVTTITGYVAEIFETTVTVDPTGTESDSIKATAAAVETLALRNGRYRVEIAAEQAGTDRWGRWVQGVKVGD